VLRTSCCCGVGQVLLTAKYAELQKVSESRGDELEKVHNKLARLQSGAAAIPAPKALAAAALAESRSVSTPTVKTPTALASSSSFSAASAAAASASSASGSAPSPPALAPNGVSHDAKDEASAVANAALAAVNSALNEELAEWFVRPFTFVCHSSIDLYALSGESIDLCLP
jgi:hypothetical protein